MGVWWRGEKNPFQRVFSLLPHNTEYLYSLHSYLPHGGMMEFTGLDLGEPYVLAKKQYVILEKKALAEGGEKGRLEFLSLMGRRDLFFLLVRILGRRDIDHPWLFARCREVQAKPNGHLDLWAREHGKSSIITFGQTIRDILNNPEITVGIFSHTRPVAKDFLGQIKFEFERNQLLQTCFPDVLWEKPKRDAPIWSLDKGIVVKRKKNPKEATVEAWGLIDGQPTGKHFSLLVYDDVVTRESVSTPEMIAKVTDAWALSLNLGARGGQQRYIGTRYHHNDTYKTILEREAACGRVYPATKDGLPNGEPVLLSSENLDKKRQSMGLRVFGCQMLLDPQADLTRGFQESWLRYWQKPDDKFSGGASFNRYIVVDPAGSRKKNSDYTVMLVIGLGEDGNWYLIDGVRDRLNLSGRAESLFRLHRKYKPNAVGYEQYGMQADIEFMESEQERRNYRFGITALGGAMSKMDRILALAPYFEQGRVFLPFNCTYRNSEGVWNNLVEEFVAEFLDFPVSNHDDMLDCMARILDPKLGASFPSAPEVAVEGGQAIIEYDYFK